MVKIVLLRRLLILKYLNLQSCENIKSTPLVVLKIYASAVVLSYIFIGQSVTLKYRESVQFFITGYDEYFSYNLVLIQIVKHCREHSKRLR